MAMRLQKIIAMSGLVSRREAERLIDEGKVSVNGSVILKQGVLADPSVDDIRVKGRRLSPPDEKVYVLFNKPRGCVTTTKDEKGRQTVMDFVTEVKVRVYPVGRLDFNTEGALLLTNDGDTADKLLDPKYKVPRTYQVKVRGVPIEKTLNRLRRGVRLDNRPTLPLKVTVQRTTGKNSFLELELTEGKKHHIRRICEKVGHPVVKISRIKFANVDLTNLPSGAYRFLSPREIRELKKMVSSRGR